MAAGGSYESWPRRYCERGRTLPIFERGETLGKAARRPDARHVRGSSVPSLILKPSNWGFLASFVGGPASRYRRCESTLLRTRPCGYSMAALGQWRAGSIEAAELGVVGSLGPSRFVSRTSRIRSQGQFSTEVALPRRCRSGPHPEAHWPRVGATAAAKKLMNAMRTFVPVEERRIRPSHTGAAMNKAFGTSSACSPARPSCSSIAAPSPPSRISIGSFHSRSRQCMGWRAPGTARRLARRRGSPKRPIQSVQLPQPPRTPPAGQLRVRLLICSPDRDRET